MTSAHGEPRLSIVITARGVASAHLRMRALEALRFNHEQLSVFGVSHEFVLVDVDPLDDAWVTDAGAVAGLNDGTLSVLEVDSRYRDAFPATAARDGFEFVARNAGIRRARGTFVLSTTCCVCLGRRVLRRVADGEIESGVLYRAPRIDIGVGSLRDAVCWNLLEQPGRVMGRAKALQPPMYLGSTGDFILLDRQSFLQLRGFREACSYVDTDADAFVLKALKSGFRIQSFGAPVYRLHVRIDETSTTRGAAPEPRSTRKAAVHDQFASRATLLDAETWGLSAAPERHLGPHRVRLDFDWSAIPALVDLNRVVLRPAAR